MRGAILLVVLVLAMGACTDSDSELIGADPGETDGQSRDSENGSGADENAAEGEPLQVESGFTSETSSTGTRNTSAGALVTNPNSDLAGYSVQALFNLKAEDGAVLDSASPTVSYIAPGETVPVAPLQIGFDIETEPTTLEVLATGEFGEDEGPSGPFGGELLVLEFVGGTVRSTQFGTELDAQVRNPHDQVAETAAWDCVFLSGEEIVGGSPSAIVDRIPPGATVQFGTPLSVDIQADDVQCRIVVN